MVDGVAGPEDISSSVDEIMVDTVCDFPDGTVDGMENDHLSVYARPSV